MKNQHNHVIFEMSHFPLATTKRFLESKNGFVVTILIQIAKGMTFLRTLDKLLIPTNLNISTFERQQIIVFPPGSRGKNCI